MPNRGRSACTCPCRSERHSHPSWLAVIPEMSGQARDGFPSLVRSPTLHDWMLGSVYARWRADPIVHDFTVDAAYIDLNWRANITYVCTWKLSWFADM
jgi:hypothetical protein